MATPRVFDRQRSFGGGVDAFRPPSEIDPNQSQMMQNMVVRDNFACRTRPGVLQIDTTNPSFKTNVWTNNPVPGTGSPVQSLFYFSTPAHPSILLMAEGGNFYTWDGGAWTTPLAFTLSNSSVHPAMDQGLNAMFISDGVKMPVYWDGATFTAYTNNDDFRYASGTVFLDGVTIACFSAGRMVVSGNPAFPDTIFCSLINAFAPVANPGPGNWDSVALSLQVGNGDGEAIVGMAAMQNQILAVLKENSVWLVDMSTLSTNPLAPTANWSAVSQGDLVGAGVGLVGRDAWCLYQNDLLFMSQDGVQSLQRMQAAAGQYQLTAPLSLPMQPYIDRINWSVSYLIKAVKYRQLAIFFVPLDNSTFNNYALVWNGRLGQWTGHWLMNVSAVCTSRFSKIEQLIFGGNDGTVDTWLDAPGLLDLDSTYLDNGVAIPWEVDTRSFIFGNFDAQKKPRAALVRFDEGNATVNFAATCDDTEDDMWSGQVQPTGPVLPVILPFVLGSSKPVPVYRSLEGVSYFSEIYLKISSPGGYAQIRNVTMAGWLKPMKDPNA